MFRSWTLQGWLWWVCFLWFDWRTKRVLTWSITVWFVYLRLGQFLKKGMPELREFSLYKMLVCEILEFYCFVILTGLSEVYLVFKISFSNWIRLLFNWLLFWINFSIAWLIKVPSNFYGRVCRIYYLLCKTLGMLPLLFQVN